MSWLESGGFRICCTLLFLLSLCHSHLLYPERIFSTKKSITAPEDGQAYRLPSHLKPYSYVLTIQTLLDSSNFTGSVEILFGTIESTKMIVLHADTNFIPLSSIKPSLSDSTITVDPPIEDTVHEMISFNLNKNLTVGQNYTLSILYDGILGNDMLGYYLSTYNTSSTVHNMAITQFESTYARRAFPCFDEPAFRAQFVVKLYRSSDQNSMANMPLESSVPDSTTGQMIDTYLQSPPMPTYLVAFGVSDLVNVSTNSGTFRMFARAAGINETSYILSVGPTILVDEGNIVNVNYSLPKMDLVAVPDFDAGAMENWGLNTYREKYLLYNKTLNTWRDKFSMLSVVAHEFGHQWFGDLVTPLWWDYSWLNEAFATYFEYISTHMFPEWGMGDTMYVMEAVQSSLADDVGSPRPMTSPVYTPEEINGLFDYVIYEKGGSVLRMAENFLTPAVWRDGLNRYLTANQYGTGTPEELFLALQTAADAANTGLSTVNETLQHWTTQGGYPLVTISLVSSTSDSTVYTLTQAPYELDASLSKQTWNIPLRCTTGSELQFNATEANIFWFYPATSSSQNITFKGNSWVICNVNQVGFYRVNYDEENWSKLKSQLDSDFTVIGTINRAQILDDALHLARSGHLNYSIALGLTNYLTNETETAPWNSFFINMRFLLNQFYGTSTGDGLKKYAQKIMATPFAALTADLTATLSTYYGSYTLWSAGLFSCEVELSNCTTLLYEIFVNWQSTKMVLIPELKQAVFCTGLTQNTSIAAFKDVWEYYLDSNNGAEKLTVMNAMGCTAGEDAITMYLDNVCDVSKNDVRLQDRWIVFRGLVSHQSGISTMLSYIANNYDKVYSALGRRITAVIGQLATSISQEAHITQVKSIVNNATVAQNLRNMLNSTVLPAVAKRQAWAESSQATALKTWVSDQSPPSPVPVVTTPAPSSATMINLLVTLMVAALFILMHMV